MNYKTKSRNVDMMLYFSQTNVLFVLFVIFFFLAIRPPSSLGGVVPFNLHQAGQAAVDHGDAGGVYRARSGGVAQAGIRLWYSVWFT